MAERFYLNGNWQTGDRVRLEGTEHHHMAHVLRVEEGEEVVLLNGKGAKGIAVVKNLDKKGSTLELVEVENHPLSPPRYLLGLPLMRPAKLEWVLEKGTELNCDGFWLYSADLSEKEKLSEHQMERLEHIAISAMKQCGRLDLPQIRLFKNLYELLENAPLPCFFGDVKKEAPPLPAKTECLFISGPEKGFSEKETKLLDAKAKGVRLHSNILRAETAPLAALSKLTCI